jgi:hypothetical protein
MIPFTVDQFLSVGSGADVLGFRHRAEAAVLMKSLRAPAIRLFVQSLAC